MDRVDSLTETVRSVVTSYATEGYNGAGEPSKLYYVENSDEHAFCVVAPYDPSDQKALLIVMTRIVNDQVIIDQDNTSVSLYSELVEAGIPENQIVMAWRLKRS